MPSFNERFLKAVSNEFYRLKSIVNQRTSIELLQFIYNLGSYLCPLGLKARGGMLLITILFIAKDFQCPRICLDCLY